MGKVKYGNANVWAPKESLDLWQRAAEHFGVRRNTLIRVVCDEVSKRILRSKARNVTPPQQT